LAGFASTLWSGSKALLNLFSLLLITPVVAFYLLNDWQRLVARIDSWLPRQHLTAIRAIANDIDKALAAFVRGQGAVCLVMATFYALGYWLVGLKGGFAIGLASGLLTFIPFFGALIGGAAALLTGFLQFWPSETGLLGVAAVLLIGQFSENNFLSPKLVGDSIGLHPVFMMLALLGFSYIFGLMGLLLAVPLAAASAVLVRHGLLRYLASEIYLGHTYLDHGMSPPKDE
jgi:predicted PurR-regulated permease PerM